MISRRLCILVVFQSDLFENRTLSSHVETMVGDINNLYSLEQVLEVGTHNGL